MRGQLARWGLLGRRVAPDLAALLAAGRQLAGRQLAGRQLAGRQLTRRQLARRQQLGGVQARLAS